MDPMLTQPDNYFPWYDITIPIIPDVRKLNVEFDAFCRQTHAFGMRCEACASLCGPDYANQHPNNPDFYNYWQLLDLTQSSPWMRGHFISPCVLGIGYIFLQRCKNLEHDIFEKSKLNVKKDESEYLECAMEDWKHLAPFDMKLYLKEPGNATMVPYGGGLLGKMEPLALFQAAELFCFAIWKKTKISKPM